MSKKILAILFAVVFPTLALANTYTLPTPNNDMIGKVTYDYIKPGKNIKQLARENDIGYYEILQANPHINPQKTYDWQKFTIPSKYLLPDAPRSGLVMNIAELRVYNYPANSNKVITYPTAIGMLGMETPTGTFKVIERLDHPKWYVPKSEIAEMAKQGVYLPKVMDSNPANPLGYYGLRLSARTYLFHGTNVPPTVGRRASAGCMHLYPENIKALYEMVPVGTNVTIVDQPFKAGWVGNTLYFQAVTPLYEDRQKWMHNYRPIYTKVIKDAVKQVNAKVDINWQKVKEMLKEPNGIPQPIGHIP